MNTITLNLAAMTPETLEGLLRLFWSDTDAIDWDTYRAIRRMHTDLVGYEETARVMDEIDPQGVTIRYHVGK